ncbi:hypothetical protein SCG7086_AA_00700 [Chlamydiales bacterium SCGC AG-110-P3]|nr:hypothetical protein SCG7086_AA_00700 [Chlamydiales bacterium SCGC AG-110-P3]
MNLSELEKSVDRLELMKKQTLTGTDSFKKLGVKGTVNWIGKHITRLRYRVLNALGSTNKYQYNNETILTRLFLIEDDLLTLIKSSKGDNQEKYINLFNRVEKIVHSEDWEDLIDSDNPKEIKLLYNCNYGLLYTALNTNSISMESLLKSTKRSITTDDMHFLLNKSTCSGDTDSTKALLEEGGNRNTIVPGYKYEHGKTILHLAVESGHKETVELLLDKEFDTTIWDGNGRTPLHLAAMENSADAINALLAGKADINAVDSKGNTPLHLAAAAGSAGAINALLAGNPGITAVNGEGHTPLHLAADAGSVELVNALLEKNADINAVDNQGNTPFHLAIKTGSVELVNALLEKNADINAVDNQGNTPFHLAAEKDEKEMINALLTKSLNTAGALSKPNYKGLTALQLAAVANSAGAINALLDGKADINAVNSKKNTALHLAAMANSPDAINALLDGEADINAMNSEGNTALHLAADAGSEEALNALLKKNPDLSIVNNEKNTPLHTAINTKRPRGKIVELILKNSNPKTVNLANKDGNTALHLSLMSRDSYVYRWIAGYLIDVDDIDVNKLNNDRKSPLSIAIENENCYSSLKLLESRKRTGLKLDEISECTVDQLCKSPPDRYEPSIMYNPYPEISYKYKSWEEFKKYLEKNRKSLGLKRW